MMKSKMKHSIERKDERKSVSVCVLMFFIGCYLLKNKEYLVLKTDHSCLFIETLQSITRTNVSSVVITHKDSAVTQEGSDAFSQLMRHIKRVTSMHEQKEMCVFT